ncbi:hypothetical protein HUS23_09445 [Ectothiorhodospiraceae bacterium 2226]|nr:hypothetical protein HUS23_09445 [Ectothiorhodospiraceae bacterium 2226]
MDPTEVDAKLGAARTRLILERPFLGALVLRLPLVAAPWCKSAGTDARRIFYKPEYIAALDARQAQFVLAQQALHCGLAHFARRGHRIKQRWDLACEYAVNMLLLEEGLEPPPGALVEQSFAGMSAEEIYPYVLHLEDEEPMDDHLAEGSESESEGQQPEGEGEVPRPPPLSAQEREALEAQWRQRLTSAAQQAALAGKLHGSLAELAGSVLQPRVPWRALLARFVSATARDDYSYSRPSNRRGGEAIFPSLRSPQIDMVVAVDSSGSIDDALLREFLGEVEAIKGQMRARVTLLLCDAALAPHGPWHVEPWEPLQTPPLVPRGGGTRFTPVFEWVERQDLRPELLIYFTDALGEFPAAAPDYPVVWLVKGKAAVPWGQRVQLN